MKRVLFICSQNRLRSPTAEKIYSGTGNIEVRSAGLDSDAVTTVTDELISWADIIFIMEKSHQNQLLKKFEAASTGKKIVCLHIPDEYTYMDPHLVQLLRLRVRAYLGMP